MSAVMAVVVSRGAGLVRHHPCEKACGEQQLFVDFGHEIYVVGAVVSCRQSWLIILLLSCCRWRGCLFLNCIYVQLRTAEAIEKTSERDIEDYSNQRDQIEVREAIMLPCCKIYAGDESYAIRALVLIVELCGRALTAFLGIIIYFIFFASSKTFQSKTRKSFQNAP